MKIKKSTLTLLCNVLCILLLLTILVLQFTPYWSVNENEVSISDYLWFPDENSALTDYFEDAYEAANLIDFKINSIVLPSVIMLVAPVLAIIFFLINSKSLTTAILSAICGIAGVYAFFTRYSFQLGSLYVVYGVISIVLIVAAVASVCMFILEKKAPEKV